MKHSRTLLVAVLIQHQRAQTSGCSCGWAPLGKSFAEHVADIYGAALGGPSTEPEPLAPGLRDRA